MNEQIEVRIKQNEKRLRSILEASHDGILVEENETIVYVNKSYLQIFGYDCAADLTGRNISAVIAPEDLRRVSGFGRSRLSGANPPSKYEFKGLRKDGAVIDVEASVSKSAVAGKVLITTFLRDISERNRTQLLIAAQNNSLEMVIAGKPLGKILKFLTEVVDRQTNGRSVASILLLDESGHLRNGASPSLPDDYIKKIDGLKADANLGTCCAAAALGEVVITPDIATDAKWQNLKHLPLELGFQAAWSMPIKAHDGLVLGTFGTYFREKRGPDALERQMVELLARTAALAIERIESEEALRRSYKELERRVFERTRELTEAVDTLESETSERLRIEKERVQLLKRIVTTQEEERRRIARDMHDHFGQQLTALRLKLEAMRNKFSDNAALCEEIEQTQGTAAKLDSDMSFLIWELRPAALDDLGLREALANYIRRWSKQFSIAADFHIGAIKEQSLSGEIKTHFYRIAQEALNNICKHARATQVGLLLEQKDGLLAMIIEDDGIGFELEEKLNRSQGLGLVGMRERAALVGGKMEIESNIGTGTNIYVRVRIERTEKKNDE